MSEQDRIRRKIDENWDGQVEALRELLSIKSVVSPPEGDFPFGKGVQEAFEYVLKLGESFGFSTENADNYGGHLEWGGEIYDGEGELISVSDEVMGIVCHLDTVPEGNDWDFSPFAGEISEGRLYGRGAIDNKGPTISTLFAMKALQDLGLSPQKKVRLILGLDEETKWEGMEYYLSKAGAPNFGFTPDGEFPAINGEKGILVFDLARKFQRTTGKGLELRSLQGGTAANMVADWARAVIKAEDPARYEEFLGRIAFLREEEKLDIRGRKLGKSLEITVKGVSSHGARPELGINAISLMMEFLGELNFAKDDVNDFIHFYNKHIGRETDGKSLGCRLEDEPSGATVLNVGMAEMDTKAARLTINIRYPVTAEAEDIYASLTPVCTRYNLGIVKGKIQQSIYIPQDDPFIKTLMDIYGEHTGDREGRPKVIGGGTYARAFKNVVAFGSSFPGEPDVAHQKNEFIDMEKFRLMTNIYAEAIYRLTDVRRKQTKEEKSE